MASLGVIGRFRRAPNDGDIRFFKELLANLRHTLPLCLSMQGSDRHLFIYENPKKN